MSEPDGPPFVHHGLPEDTDVLAALGRIALRHGQLDNQLRMLVGDLTGVSKNEALDATFRDGSGQLRERIRRLAKSRLGDGPAFVRLQSLLVRAGRVTAKRNELVHSVWGTELDGPLVLRGDDNTFRRAPTAAELMDFHEQITTVLDEVIDARMDGFLAEALKGKPLGLEVR